MSQTTYIHGTDILIAGQHRADDKLDRVAAVCHEQWRYWAEFMLSNPEEYDRFRALVATNFTDLEEYDKNADRHWARLMLRAAEGSLDCRFGDRPAPPTPGR